MLEFLSQGRTDSKVVYVLRCCREDLTSRDGFQWVGEGPIEAPHWDPEPRCGAGLHGWLWGEGDLSACDYWNNSGTKWLVVGVWEADLVKLEGKVKFPRAYVVFCGDREGAVKKIIELGAHGAVMFANLTGGDRSTLTGGNRSTLTGGDRSTLTGGNRSTLTGGYYATLTGGDYATLTGGYRSTLTGGDYATLTGGYRSTLTGGDYATLTGGYRSTLTGGDYATLTGGVNSTLTGGVNSTLTGGYESVLTFKVWDGKRYRLHTFYVGENGVEANKPYKFIDGKLVPA